jgi:hypothetical protein
MSLSLIVLKAGMLIVALLNVMLRVLLLVVVLLSVFMLSVVPAVATQNNFLSAQ